MKLATFLKFFQRFAWEASVDEHTGNTHTESYSCAGVLRNECMGTDCRRKIAFVHVKT